MDSKTRIYSLDYLRGLMASSIMIFHFCTWQIGEFSSSHILGKLGIYGVSIFYILSGLTLYKVYYKKFNAPTLAIDVKHFFIKRVFRIIPLLSLVSIITFFAGKHHDIERLLLNITGLFGFIAPEKYVAVGAWSIGNELVFYAFFPIVIILLKRHIKLFFLFCALMMVLSLIFSAYLLNPASPLGEPNQWKLYVNPFNQFYLFLSGIIIGYLIDQSKFAFLKTLETRTQSFLIIIVVFILVVIPVSGGEIMLVTGYNRIIFSILSILLSGLFYVYRGSFGSLINGFLKLTGDISYSIYLLHPLCFFFLQRLLKINSMWIIPVSIILTYISSYLIYRFFESVFVKLGNRLCSKQTDKQLI
ncbi:acyltransferase family protein [Pedobacter caeni]|uniref:Peptidoglycan/LPS O-acetylase OafA/YrhL, contains acyltransferase and SGNH-hydrolase domains n=1 Tax=Pedobacter caeni TaxID=288992 RepID=A0A1M5PQE9_9SPHI|nr:Peptidoglycan/LPS O-acetylase OafA/YrhL, contains acyltransferase and SGNH-hydrolase domains [Pedobacter caeni]